LTRLKLINRIISLSIISAISLFIITFFLFIWLSKDLPLPDKVIRKEGFSTVILDRNDKPIYDIYTDKNRIPVPFSDLPDSLKKATIAVEDKDFYKHQGFDPKGILRALFNIATFRGVQGGSTLTQQLVKNVLLSSEKTITRKIKEFILAVQIERKYSKDEILQMYLNEAPYGGTMWGIESAAEGYFGKHAKELTPIESIFLAGLPQRPSVYSPFGGTPKAYVKRTEEVLRRMREDNYITPTSEYDFKKQLQEVKFASSSSQFIAPHFVMYVKKQLVDQFGGLAVNETGLRVKTTLDRDLQIKTEAIVREELDKLKGLKVSNGAVVVLDPTTGGILAYAGSRDYDAKEDDFEGKFDVVSMGFRQPGSALKPITYAVAFTKGYTPSSLLMDVETHFPAGAGKPDYVPKNYDGKFRGPVQIRYALANSINVPAVKITALVGIRDILKMASDMGLSTLSPTDDNVRKLGLSLTLGGGEVRLLDLADAFGVFATGGIKNDLYSIVNVTDNSGKTLFEHKPVLGKRVLGEDVSFLISNILSDNDARKDVFGLNSYLYIPGKTVAVKTGTTDDKKDNWTVGYTPSVVAGVWVGNNDNSPMDPKLASGVTGAAPIWNRVMREALKEKSDETVRKPDNIIPLTIDAFAGGIPHEGKPTRTEYFIKGTEPTSLSPVYMKIKLSKSDNKKLANPVEIINGSYDEKEYIVFKETDPISTDGKNRWQEGVDAWVGTQGDLLYHPPSDTSSASDNAVAVRIKNPADKSQIDSNSVQVLAEGRGIKDIKKMEIYVDGSLKTTVNNNSLDENLNLDTGIHKIKVKAYNISGDTGEAEITIGIKVSPNPTATPVPSPTITPSLSPTP
ncbi:transglycosylase domain-containing protein, partial [Candidatus Gottesmanbacteria bacterium]|nr:transglycosylase domain-containing protein [Candidatus Gottesmanbacteria bacterium]